MMRLLMTTPVQQSSATALPISVKKLNSSPSTMSFPLFSEESQKHNVPVFGRDMNGQIGKKAKHKFSQYHSSKRNRQNLIDFTIEKN